LPDEADIGQPHPFPRVAKRPVFLDDGNAAQLAETPRPLCGTENPCGPVWIHFNTNKPADPPLSRAAVKLTLLLRKIIRLYRRNHGTAC